MNKEIYISVDIESDGPIPGAYSMLSLGAAAYSIEGGTTPIGTFEVNMDTLHDASQDPDTMKWWKTQPEAWEAGRKDLNHPETAMLTFVEWLRGVCGKSRKPVFVGYPAGFDFLFVYWYLIKFTGKSPFSFSALDIKTYAMCMLKKEYRKSGKQNMPKRWFGDQPHTHRALDDAIGQGQLFMNMLKENLKTQDAALVTEAENVRAALLNYKLNGSDAVKQIEGIYSDLQEATNLIRKLRTENEQLKEKENQ